MGRFEKLAVAAVVLLAALVAPQAQQLPPELAEQVRPPGQSAGNYNRVQVLGEFTPPRTADCTVISTWLLGQQIPMLGGMLCYDIDDHEFRYWSEETASWEVFASGGPGGGAEDLDDLTDVTLTAPTDGQILIRNGGQFGNFTLGGDVTMSITGQTTVADNSHAHHTLQSDENVTLQPDLDFNGTGRVSIYPVPHPEGSQNTYFDLTNDGVADLRWTNGTVSGGWGGGSFLSLIPKSSFCPSGSTGCRTGIRFNYHGGWFELMTSQHGLANKAGMYLRGPLDLNFDGVPDTNEINTTHWEYWPVIDAAGALNPYFTMRFYNNTGVSGSPIFSIDPDACRTRYPTNADKWVALKTSGRTVCIDDLLDLQSATSQTMTASLTTTGNILGSSGVWSLSGLTGLTLSAKTQLGDQSQNPNVPLIAGGAKLIGSYSNGDWDEDGLPDHAISSTFTDYSGSPYYEGETGFRIDVGAFDGDGALGLLKSTFVFDGHDDKDGDSSVDAGEVATLSLPGRLISRGEGAAGAIQFNRNGSNRPQLYAGTSPAALPAIVFDLDGDGTMEAADACVIDGGMDANCDGVAETGGPGGGLDALPTPADNQVAVFVDEDTVEGSNALFFDGTSLSAPAFISTGGCSGNDCGVLLSPNTGNPTAPAVSGQVFLYSLNGVPYMLPYGATTPGGRVLTHTTVSGDVTVSSGGVATIGADAVTLGADTAGSYVSAATASMGLAVTGGAEGGTVGLQTCGTPGHILKSNGTTWACQPDDTSGGTGYAIGIDPDQSSTTPMLHVDRPGKRMIFDPGESGAANLFMDEEGGVPFLQGPRLKTPYLDMDGGSAEIAKSAGTTNQYLILNGGPTGTANGGRIILYGSTASPASRTGSVSIYATGSLPSSAGLTVGYGVVGKNRIELDPDGAGGEAGYVLRADTCQPDESLSSDGVRVCNGGDADGSVCTLDSQCTGTPPVENGVCDPAYLSCNPVSVAKSNDDIDLKADAEGDGTGNINVYAPFVNKSPLYVNQFQFDGNDDGLIDVELGYQAAWGLYSSGLGVLGTNAISFSGGVTGLNMVGFKLCGSDAWMWADEDGDGTFDSGDDFAWGPDGYDVDGDCTSDMAGGTYGTSSGDVLVNAGGVLQGDSGLQWAAAPDVLSVGSGGFGGLDLDADATPDVMHDGSSVTLAGQGGSALLAWDGTLPDCDGDGSALGYDASTGKLVCGDDDSGGGGGGAWVTGGIDIDGDGTNPIVSVDGTADEVHLDANEDGVVDVELGTTYIAFDSSTRGRILFDKTNGNAALTWKLCTADLFLFYDADNDGNYDANDDYCMGPTGYDYNCDCVADVPATASALAANGANCDAGQAARGVDASGAAEGCFTPPDTGDELTVDGTATSTPNLDDGGDINFAYSSPNITATVKADSVALGTDTTGNYAASDAESGDALTIKDSAAASVSGAGEIKIDTTANQLLYYGGAARVLDPRQTLSISVLTPAEDDNPIVLKAPYGMTITDIDCIVDPAGSGESVVIDVQECNGTGDSCGTVDATITCDNDGAADDGSLTNGGIDSGDWIILDIGTVTGTVSNLSVTVTYTIVQE